MGHYDCKSCDATPYEDHSPDCERFGTKPPPTEGTDMSIEQVARAKADAQKLRWDHGIPVRVLWRDGRAVWSKIDDEGRDLTVANSDGILHHVRSVFVPHGATNPLAAMTVQAEPVAWMYSTVGVKKCYPYKLPDWSPAKDPETPLYAHPPAPQWQGIESDTTVERCFLWCTDKVPTGIVVGSVRNGKARSNALIGDWTFTHWMPLPTPPNGGSDAE